MHGRVGSRKYRVAGWGLSRAGSGIPVRRVCAHRQGDWVTRVAFASGLGVFGGQQCLPDKVSYATVSYSVYH